MSAEELAKFGFTKQEQAQLNRKGKKTPTDYPAPLGRYRMVVEGFNVSVEEPYFWVLDYLRYMWSFTDIDKIKDIFSASENSAFFGATWQRIGVQQDKVSQFLATIGKMVKELFQIVREMRIIDERIGYYTDSYSNSKSSESAEITLKGIWVDMVEQGAKNPASVYGIAREVQFITLPDLFFATHPRKQEDVDEVIEKTRGQFNRKVREVLKRKLREFLAWKEHTYEEIKNRRKFTLKYLRQHYEIIKMYMHWVRPYLKNIQRLQMDQKKSESPDLLVAFETSMIEIEILAKSAPKSGLNQVILVHFMYRTRPEMSYQQEGYQRGPLHVGRVDITFRSYVWDQDQIHNYKRYRDLEDIKLLSVVDGSVKAAMESLGDELLRYLAEAGDDVYPTDKQKKDKETILSPYMSIFRGFNEIFSKKQQVKGPKKLTRDELFERELVKASLSGSVRKAMWGIYHHFKKHHGMLNW